MERAQKQSLNRRSILFSVITLTVASAIVLGAAQQAEAQQRPAPGPSARKPNILMIMADDIGWFNVSAYNHGIMGYRTPNIDRIAKEGALFTDWYGEQSCTAGRAAFITGQSPIRTGLTKVGLPGADIGLRRRRPERRGSAQAARLRHRPVRQEPPRRPNEFLPTVHGFDEFFGNLYHLNAEEEPENPDYPKNPRSAEFGSGSRCRRAIETTRPSTQPTGGSANSHRKYGSADTKRMETVDEEFLNAALDFIDRKHKANTPWFCYFNPTRMHVWTHLKAGLARQDRPRRLSGWHGGIGRLCRPTAQEARRPRRCRQHHRRLHDRQRRRGDDRFRTAAARRFVARRQRTGKADTACRWSCAGPAPSSPAPSITRCSRTTT